MVVWNTETETQVATLRQEGKSVRQIAEIMESTTSAIKHKLRRLGQASNESRYTHPTEKVEQLDRILPNQPLNILETHAGYGNLTKYYQQRGYTTLAIEIEPDRSDAIRSQYMEDVDVITGDSLQEMLLLEYRKCWFDVVDLDPYGFPSRFIPSALRLIKDGWLFMTMPKVGVSQMNKITVRHLESFWHIEPKSKPDLINTVVTRLDDLGFQNGRAVELVDAIDLGRMYRFAFKVERKPMTELVGLVVNRNPIKDNTPSLFD